MLAIRAPGRAARMSATARAVSASPANTTVSARTPARPRPSTCANADGTALTTLADTSVPANATTSRTTSTRPPHINGHTTSNTDTSKLNDVDATTRDKPSTPNCRAAHDANATTLACDTTTPLGRPVDPDVKITYAGCAPTS